MKQTTTAAAHHSKLRFWKKALSVITMQAMLVMMLGQLGGTCAQPHIFTFMGDYDPAFGGGLGYYVDPQLPDPALSEEGQTHFISADVMSDGSIIAGGNFINFGGIFERDFYLKKFLPSGAPDTSFNGGRGFIRSEFRVLDPNPHASAANPEGDGATPVEAKHQYLAKVKVLPDDKILVVGVCDMSGATTNAMGQTIASPISGKAICMMRFQPNGALDTTFGTAGTYQFGLGLFRYREVPGMVLTPIQNTAPFRSFTSSTLDGVDALVQPDGKILIAGYSQSTNAELDTSGFLLRHTAQGALDTTFGNNGTVHYFSTPAQPAECTLKRRFFGVALQPDGRILALGSDGTVNLGNCGNGGDHGNRFVVTRWSANGQFESARHLDNITAHVSGRSEGAFAALITRDGAKVLVSGTYKDLRPNPGSAIQTTTLVRLNLSDLSLDNTFGIKQFSGCGSVFCGVTSGGEFRVKAIQPDGRILGIDRGYGGLPRVNRFNPDGSVDLSFGNAPVAGGAPLRGSLHLNVVPYNNVSNMFSAEHLIVRPGGRINLIGYAYAFGRVRAVISQQNTTFKNGVYSDFENDGEANLSVYRDGTWFSLNSTVPGFNPQGQPSSAAQWGLASDKIAPADYDGDGKTDTAVFRDGQWFIRQSSDSQTRTVGFGLAGDLPRPGDFDGDGLADIAVFRPATGIWYIQQSGNGQMTATQFGASGDAPLLADFDGDGRSDLGVYRHGTWYWLRSSDNGFASMQFGQVGDVPVVGDYDGDSKADPAVFRPSTGTWYQQRSQMGYTFQQFGQNGDRAVPGDYDNDGRHDLAVYRHGSWYVLQSGDGTVKAAQFGAPADLPVPAAYLP